MTTTVIFKAGEPNEITLHQGESISSYKDQRLSQTDELSHREPVDLKDFGELAVLYFPQGDRIIEDTVSGEVLHMPDVESITFMPSLVSKEG